LHQWLLLLLKLIEHRRGWSSMLKKEKTEWTMALKCCLPERKLSRKKINIQISLIHETSPYVGTNMPFVHAVCLSELSAHHHSSRLSTSIAS
jgi:hypothetical protein